MFDKKVIDLPLEERTKFYYRTGKIKTLSKEIRRLVDYLEWKKVNLKKQIMVPEHLRLEKNQNVEDQEEMRDAILTSTNSTEDKIRLWNLYLGMRYILEDKKISPENLRNLYQIISHNIVNFEDKSMGEFYRQTREYIYHYGGFFSDFSEAVKPENVSRFMEEYFSYVDSEEEQSKIDIFLKSQIMHLYFVYVHPYLDGNGRSARLVSSWYLLNHKADEFVLFNKVITDHKSEYQRSVRKSIETKDFTHYLVFILNKLKEEFEKIKVIEELEENLEVTLSHFERQLVDIVLSLGEDSTIDEILDRYSNYDPHNSRKKVLTEKLYPLIESGILKEENGKIRIGNIEKKREEQYGG